MEVFRLARAPYARTLSGKGAAIKGARWNSVGVEIIYCASNRSLAMAEVAVHFTFATLPDDYTMIVIHIPEATTIREVSEHDLPPNWNAFPHPPSTQRIGDQFIAENSHCLLRVPSVVTKGDYNVLINPNHPQFAQISIISVEPFPFDSRLFK